MPQSNDYERLRGWILITLYGSMALLSLMILYALFMLQASFAGQTIAFYMAVAAALASVLFNARASGVHFRIIREGLPLPRLALKPFLFMAILLLLAGRLFGGL